MLKKLNQLYFVTLKLTDFRLHFILTKWENRLNILHLACISFSRENDFEFEFILYTIILILSTEMA